MGKNTKISWADHTFNPWRGCSKVSEGCKYCYAEINTTARVARAKGIETWGKNASRIVTGQAQWNQVRLWNKKAEGWLERPRVFVASLADVFEDYKGGNVCDHKGKHLHKTLDPVRSELFYLIMSCPNLDFLMLTKRPDNIMKCLYDLFWHFDGLSSPEFCRWLQRWVDGSPPDNVWLGTSVENQKALKRIEDLLKVPAKIRFVSFEPLLEEVDPRFRNWSHPDSPGQHIHWGIIGGESGSKCRPFDETWARLLIEDHKAAEMPVFMKQLGGHPDKRDNFDLFPDELKCQEFPV